MKIFSGGVLTFKKLLYRKIGIVFLRRISDHSGEKVTDELILSQRNSLH